MSCAWRKEWCRYTKAVSVGATLDTIAESRKRQGGRCLICWKVPKVLVVDHDHATNTFRAMLCREHNSALGLFGESIPILERAIEYLRSPAHLLESSLTLEAATNAASAEIAAVSKSKLPESELARGI